MSGNLHKIMLRDIRGSLGRFFAIFAIIALGVGFFSGVRITTPAMVHTMDRLYQEKSFFDYRLISTLGWEEEDVEVVRQMPDVSAADGALQYDMICVSGEGEDRVYRAHSLTEKVNGLILREGRLPEKADEVVLDSRNPAELSVGDSLLLSDSNSEETLGHFSYKEYKIVGMADSSLYINFERGTTSLGNGSVSGFLYMTEDGFQETVYTDIYVRLRDSGEIYSDAYKALMDEKHPDWEERLPELADRRYRMYAAYGIPKPETHLLERNTNIGYVCFENDSEIVEQVARVFPVFFILVAALVCMTTMTRMVEEQRAQIGTLKALGYSSRAIMGKFTFYAGSASLLGCIFGYSTGIFLFPGVIWTTYKLMYISLPLRFIFDWKLAGIALLASLGCSVGITLLSCRYELGETAASLMRPKAPKPGKRVLLERIPFLWKRLPFLHKVSVRNIFRYKGRFFMMILGISGSTALLLTGFGMRDSIANFADDQYGEIQTADLSVAFRNGNGAEAPEEIRLALEEGAEDYLLLTSCSMDLLFRDTVKSVSVLSPAEPERLPEYFHLRNMKDRDLPQPQPGEILISISIAERYQIHTGDQIRLRDTDLSETGFTVAGIFNNHVYNYVVVNPADLPGSVNSAFVRVKPGEDVYQVQAALSELADVASITVFDEIRTRMSKMMSSLDYIVLVVILSAAGLAFIVLYNLTNINITERIREIATIKVLGFYPGETAQYVFRENLLLTTLGTLLGLGLGVLLHRYVMAQIIVDMVHFKVRIRPFSFLLGVILTYVFTILVNLVMRRKLERINMAESLKSVE